MCIRDSLCTLLLSHPFIFLLGLLSVLIWSALHRETFRNLPILLGVFLLVSFLYLLNIFAHMDYFNLYVTLPAKPEYFPPVLAVLIPFSVKKERKIIFLLIIFLMTFLFGVTNLLTQPYRFFLYSIFFGSVLAGFGAMRIYEVLSRLGRFQKPLFISLILIPFLLAVLTPNINKEWGTDSDFGGIYEGLRDLGPGRILVDPHQDRRIYVLDEMIPWKSGKEVLNELHVDSSISAPYTLYLQYSAFNLLPMNPVCSLCSPKYVNHTLFQIQAKRFDVKYLLSRKELSWLSGRLVSELPEGYLLYEMPYSPDYYEVLNYKPIGLITDMEGWRKVNELLFLDRMMEDHILVKLSDFPKNPGRFSAIIDGRNTDPESIMEMIRKVNLTEAFRGDVENFEYTNFEINLLVSSNEEIPVLLKFSYYPKWKSDTEVYLASPSLMLIFGKGDVTLKYST